MPLFNIPQQRLLNHRLVDHPFKTPTQVVSWYGAVQSQEYALAKWGLHQRLKNGSEAAIEEAFTKGEILRTHAMRPTWHFVAPADIRWLQDLTGLRVQAFNASYYRKNELDKAVFSCTHSVLTKALEGGKFLTRAEIAAALKKAGITASGLRLGLILMRAELDKLICSGPRKGNQFTYALLDERVPPTKSLAREEALAELVKRFFTSHGPALIKDFVWWSGLTVADTKLGLELSRPHLESEEIEGQTYWHGTTPPKAKKPDACYLLQPYDEYTVAYKDRASILPAAFVAPDEKDLFFSMIIMEGSIVGSWRRTFDKGRVVIEHKPFAPFSKAQHKAFAEAANRFGEFLEMPVKLA